jgi:hypothetical protein
MKKFFLIVMVLFCFGFPLSAQGRGGANVSGEVEIIDASGELVGHFSSAHALIIGESEYTNGWRRLPGVKEDTAAVKRLFEEQGFLVETIEDASSSNLRSGITAFLDRYAYNPDARIVLYYAGHGSTIDLGGRRMGYIVPVDAPPEGNNRDFLQTAIPMTQFETWAKQYTSRHILFIFDSCFAGSVFRSQGSTPPAINRLISQPVRQFITSGDADEQVPDESIFRRELEHALRYGAADLNNDGYVSGTELGLYLYDRVSNYMNGMQNPRVGKLNDTNLDKGDFIFSTGNSFSETVTARPTPAYTPTSVPQQPPATVQALPGTTEFFIGSWVATPDNMPSDTYYISLSANGTCTVKIANAAAEQETSGNWSFDGTMFRLNAVFRNPTIAHQPNIQWVSIVRFVGNNSFNILARSAANGSQDRFTFFRN